MLIYNTSTKKFSRFADKNLYLILHIVVRVLLLFRQVKDEKKNLC